MNTGDQQPSALRRKGDELERALLETQERLDLVLQSAPLTLLTFDRAERLTLAAGNGCGSLGLDPATAVGQPICELLPGLPHLGDRIRAALSGEVVDDVFAIGDATFEVRFAPRRDVTGTLDGVTSVWSDVSERHRAQQTALAALAVASVASRAKTDFLARMSHELRTPLNAVIGFANILRRNRSATLDQRELSYLSRIADNGSALLATIHDLLDLGRLETGRVELHAEMIDVGDLVRDTADRLRGRIAVTALPMLVEVPHGLELVRADQMRLRQILVNLIDNAIKFTPQGSIKITVTADPESRRPTRIDVTDTGIGIRGSRIRRLFEAFGQNEATTTRVYDGSGVGLAISRSLAQLMGFDLTVASRLGKGTTATVILNAAAQRGARAATASPSAGSQVAGRVPKRPLQRTLRARPRLGRSL